MKNNCILGLLLVGIIFGCTEERVRILGEAEHVLPGNWHIKSVHLPGYGLGITYQGKTFFTDTILFDVGHVMINAFSGDTLAYFDNHQDGKVECNVVIENENFPVAITRLFVSGDDIFSGFEYNGPPGLHPITTYSEEFFWSSRIFQNNYYIEIIDEDNIELRKANDVGRHVITLNRL